MITIQYGPWVPDVSNNPFQMPDQEGPVEVPTVDCLNVIYSNGNYQSLPSPVAIAAPAFGGQVIGAMTFLDSNGQAVPVAGVLGGQAYYLNASFSWQALYNPGSLNIQKWNFAQFDAQIFIQGVPAIAANLIGNLFVNVPGGSSTLANISGAPFGNVLGVVGQFIMVGNLMGTQTLQTIATGDGTTVGFTGTLTNVPVYQTSVYVNITGGTGGGNGYDNGAGSISGTGIASGTINYDTGAVSVNFTTPPSAGANINVDSAPAYRARLAWSPIGNPSTTWPTPLTNAAIAVQSGIQDLEYAYGPVMHISGYPLYGVIFQKNAITRAQYIGGNVVFSWQTFSRNLGLLAEKAVIQVGTNTFFLSDSGFYYTDGANVVPIGTSQDNSAGIDKWFFANVNQSALSAIKAGYDARLRNVFFAIPTGSNTLPDTLLSYNIVGGRWTRSAVSCELLWTDNDGSTDRLGLFLQNHQYNLLIGNSQPAGYLESADLMFSDGFLRDTNGVRPNIAAASPIVTVGTRNTLNQAVSYNAGYAPDAFSAGFAPALTEGLYTRIRVSAANAANIHGATCDMTPAGEL